MFHDWQFLRVWFIYWKSWNMYHYKFTRTLNSAWATLVTQSSAVCRNNLFNLGCLAHKCQQSNPTVSTRKGFGSITGVCEYLAESRARKIRKDSIFFPSLSSVFLGIDFVFLSWFQMRSGWVPEGSDLPPTLLGSPFLRSSFSHRDGSVRDSRAANALVGQAWYAYPRMQISDGNDGGRKGKGEFCQPHIILLDWEWGKGIP
jgi:hypothetical protein